MKKILLTSVFALMATSAMAANTMMPTYRPAENHFNVVVDTKYVVQNEEFLGDINGRQADDWMTDVYGAYGITNDLSVTFSTSDYFRFGGSEATPTVGLDYRLVNTEEFGLNVFGMWGIGFQDSEEQEGTFGAKIYGGTDLSWGLTGAARYVDVNGGRWDYKILGELMIKTSDKVGVKGEIEYNMFGEDDVSDDAAVMDFRAGATYMFNQNMTMFGYVGYAPEMMDLDVDQLSFGVKMGIDF